MTDALRTYQVYAGLTFLGYEYANKENLVVALYFTLQNHRQVFLVNTL